MCSGSVEHSTRTRKLKEIGGLSKRMPLTSVATSFASLSISGVPPFNGFWSKLLIIIGAIAAGKYIIAALTVLVSFLTLVSFVKVQKYALFGELPGKLAKVKESPLLMCLSLVVLAVCCLGLGIFAKEILQLLIYPARDAVLNAPAYIEMVLSK